MSEASPGAARSLREAARGAIFLAPGLVDAALSSLAGFAASLFAVRSLEGPALGAYSLYLAAYVVGALFPQQLIYLPSQIAAVRTEAPNRPAILRPTLWRGAGIALLVAPFVGSAGLILSAEVPGSTLVALGTGAAVLTLLTPAQDQVRSTLYLAGEHVRAAAVSAAQLILTIAAMGALYGAGTPDAWVPFSALALGTAGSGLAGLALTSFPAPGSFRVPAARSLIRSGVPLLPAALIQEATVFLSAATLASIASAAALGTAEAARIVSRPVQAFSLGVSRSLAPGLMEAGEARSQAQAWRSARLYAGAMAVAGLAYLALAGWSYPLSPIEAAVPSAYQEQGLVALFLAATVAGAVVQIPRGVLLGAGKGPELLVIAVATSVVRIAAVAVLAISFDAYALPLAHLVSVLLGGSLNLRATRRLFEDAAQDGRGQA